MVRLANHGLGPLSQQRPNRVPNRVRAKGRQLRRPQVLDAEDFAKVRQTGVEPVAFGGDEDGENGQD